MKRTPCMWCIFLLFAAQEAFVQAVPEEDLLKYASAFREVIPDGWSVERIGNDVIVTRDKAVQGVHKEHATLAPDKSGVLGTTIKHKLIFSFMPKMNSSDYAMKQLEMLRVAQDIVKLKSSLDQMRQVGDTYYPVNDEQREIVNRYEDLKTKIHKLPSHYDSRNSVLIHSGDYLVVGADSVECLKVDTKLKSYFKPYMKQRTDGGPKIRMTISQAMKNLTVNSVHYRDAKLSDVLKTIDEGLHVAMDRRIDPVIRTDELDKGTLDQKITISGRNKMTAKELLNLLCSLYDMEYRTTRHNQILMSNKRK